VSLNGALAFVLVARIVERWAAVLVLSTCRSVFSAHRAVRTGSGRVDGVNLDDLLLNAWNVRLNEPM
jgi:hypothetical protein